MRITAVAVGLIAALGGLTGRDALIGGAQTLPLPSAGTAYAARLGEAGHLALSSAALMTRLVNGDRAAHGLAALRFDQGLRTFAQWRSEDMAAAGYFSHDVGNVPGRQVFDVLRAGGVTYRVAGENLAETYLAADPSAAWSQDAKIRIPTHRANIHAPDNTHHGVGVAVAPDGRTVFTQLFMTAR